MVTGPRGHKEVVYPGINSAKSKGEERDWEK
jgi:hypothetical protein